MLNQMKIDSFTVSLEAIQPLILYMSALPTIDRKWLMQQPHKLNATSF